MQPVFQGFEEETSSVDELTRFNCRMIKWIVDKLKEPQPTDGKPLIANPICYQFPTDESFIKYYNRYANDKLILREGLFGSYPVKVITEKNNKGKNEKSLNNAIEVFEVKEDGKEPWRYSVVYSETYSFSHNLFVINENDLLKFHKHAKKCFEKELKLRQLTFDIVKDKNYDLIIKNTFDYISDIKKYEKYGCSIKRGLLLEGPPGNGKTMICEHLKELFTKEGYTVHFVEAGQINDAFHKGSLKKLLNSHNLIVFDDVDISYLNRNSGKGDLACALLSAMTSSSDFPVIRIFNTNETVANMDSAFVRPGRIDLKIHFDNPTADLRRKFVEGFHQDIEINDDDFVKLTRGYSYAKMQELKNILVQRYLSTGEWSLEKSAEDFDEFREIESIKKKTMAGFGGISNDYDDDDDD